LQLLYQIRSIASRIVSPENASAFIREREKPGLGS
jgi:hypothetical protein